MSFTRETSYTRGTGYGHGIIAQFLDANDMTFHCFGFVRTRLPVHLRFSPLYVKYLTRMSSGCRSCNQPVTVEAPAPSPIGSMATVCNVSSAVHWIVGLGFVIAAVAVAATSFTLYTC